MFPAFTNDVLLNLQVLVDKIGTITQVCHNSSDMCSSQDHRLRLFIVKKLFHSQRIEQVQFLMASSYQILIPSAFEIIPNSRPHQPVVTGHIYLCVFC